jgi:hypothetical protein
MKNPVSILSLAAIALLALSTPGIAQNPTGTHAKRDSSQSTSITKPADRSNEIMQYRVIWNLEEGLVVEIYQQYQETTSIPAGLSRVGGGGGRSFTKTVWRNTNKLAFIAHTKTSVDFPIDHQFYGRSKHTGASKRISDLDVIQVIKILELTEDPTKKAKDTATGTQSPSRPRPPREDPFAKPKK